MYYVSYGSNLNKKHMSNLVPNVKPIGKGILKDYELVFRYYADVQKKKGSYVNVGIWEINSKSDEEMIDFYESYPHLYRKEMVEVEFEDRRKEECMIYIMNSNQYDLIRPSMDYLQTIIQGYKDFGIKNYACLFNAL